MAYDEEQHKKSRIVIDTPSERREYVSAETAHVPRREGISGAAVAALVIGTIALVTILFLFVMNGQNADDANLQVATTTRTTATTEPTPVQPVIVQQPAPAAQPPVIIQQPAPASTTTQPIIVPAAPNVSSGGSTSAVSDDSSVQASVDKKLNADSALSSAGIVSMVTDGRVTLTGMVDSADQKLRAERLVRSIKGVKSVDNQIQVSGSATSTSSPY
jgi:hypothetical protein